MSKRRECNISHCGRPNQPGSGATIVAGGLKIAPAVLYLSQECLDDMNPEPANQAATPLDAAGAFARQLGSVLGARRLTLATAESCTGGLVGALITAVPGSSTYYVGGVIGYANEAKMALLGVSPAILAEHGAVSAAAARAMALGVRDRLDADLAVSVTGVAGPGGGTAQKPVGLVYIGLVWAHDVAVRHHRFQGDRAAIRAAAASTALEWVLEAARRVG